MAGKVKKIGVLDKSTQTATRTASPAVEQDRLEKLYQEVEIVKMNSMRRIAEEMNRLEGEPERDVQKESQVVMKAIEIQHRLWAELTRRGGPTENEPSLEEIWRALINLPQAGAVLRRESVRARLVEELKKQVGE